MEPVAKACLGEDPGLTMRLSQSKHYWLISIIVIAVLLRVLAALYMGNSVTELPGTFDQVSYDMVAQRVLGGYGFTVATDWWPATPAGEPTAHWSYLYSLYLVAVYGLFGYQPLVARLIQAVLAGVLMPWLMYNLGCRYFSSRVGILAAALAAGYIYFVYYAAALMTETFYIISILGVLNFSGKIAEIIEQIKGAKLIIVGVTLGVAVAITVLLRQVFLLFIPILFLWLLWQGYRRQFSLAIRMASITVLATMVLILSILPWTYRNYKAFDTFVLLNTNAGFAFFWGNHPIHGYNFVSILPTDGPSYRDLIPSELQALNEAELDRALLNESLHFIQADPVRYLVLSASRIKDYFKFWPSPESSLISNLSRILSFGLLLPFMIYGVIRGLRGDIFSANILLLYLFLFTYTAIHLLSWALIRYRLPIDAILLVFTGLALIELQTKLVRRQDKVPSDYLPNLVQSTD